jgi:bifunctional UDP-N-acetylglucosamine pyrophosphorylase / glucosamine-1-phosphate N-acetyltransferase
MAPAALSALVLAAGEGTRMRSRRPKPLHLLCGRAMLLYVLDALGDCDARRAVVVVGHGADRVTKELQENVDGLTLDFVEQREQRGTGDAVTVGLTAFDDAELDGDGDVLVLPGDTPLLRASTIASLVDLHRSTDAACTVLTAVVDDPTGYGRVVRDRNGNVRRIVEHADASDDELAVAEVNTSIYCLRLSVLAPALRRLEPQNAQGEYYLTDVVEVLAEAGYTVSAMAADAAESQGVNDRLQLAAAEAELRRRTNTEWMRRGVTMVDPSRTWVDTTVDLATDVTLFPGTMLQGTCVVGAGSEIGPDARLVDCRVGAEVTIASTTGVRATVGDGCVVGPYAVLEPGAVLAPGTTVGPFEVVTGGDMS